MVMNEMPVEVVFVRNADGDRDCVTLVPAAVAFSKGLVPEAIVGQLLRLMKDGGSVTPDNFARNPVFVELLHTVVARECPKTARCVAEAKSIGNGYLYVIDQRTPTPDDAVPPEDIVGAFEVKDGAVTPASYKANPNHRILSSRGFCRLGPHLNACVVKEVQNRY
jgi:hypothetical protein